ncbi:MAG: hypothetical protein JRI52_06845 [Deltaproteobacteria bacterium]|nr:hypothetical protein [Deltaproteobacteria bacterium]
MEDVADMDIDGCVEKVVDHLESTLLPGQKQSVWDSILGDLKASDGTMFEGDYYNRIDKIVCKIIAELSDDQVIDLWNETETGLENPFDPEGDDIGCTRWHLELEIVDAVCEYAGQEHL